MRFVNNCKAKVNKTKKSSGPLKTEEIQKSRECWILRAQNNTQENLERPGWKLEKGLKTGILRCVGRVQGYHTTYFENGTLTKKLIQNEHEWIKHFGLASAMAAIRENWHMLSLRSLVKRCICNCNICNVFSTKPYEANLTALMPRFRTTEPPV